MQDLQEEVLQPKDLLVKILQVHQHKVRQEVAKALMVRAQKVNLPIPALELEGLQAVVIHKQQA